MPTASRDLGFDERYERCDRCNGVTLHTVSIRLRVVSADPVAAPFSREPFRRTRCRECGVVPDARMNDA